EKLPCSSGEPAFWSEFRHPWMLRLQSDALMIHKVTLIPGEGIGPEVAAATRRILEAAGVQIDWEEIAGRTGKPSDQGHVNQAAIESVRRNRVALKGPMATAARRFTPFIRRTS